MQLSKIFSLYKKLRKKYGQPQGQWKLWCKRPKTSVEKEEVIIGAILTQRANWKNVELAINNLRKSGLLSLKAISKFKKPSQKFLSAVKPSGFYCQKTDYLIGVAKFFMKLGGVKKAQKIKLG
ncbi:MAG: endonuclease, partial [Candidatus Paceibacteria bacterium]